MKSYSSIKNQHSKIQRREFIKSGVTLGLGSVVLGLGQHQLYGSVLSNVAAPIKDVTLNNGVKMPILGFGTLYLNDELGIKCVSDAISVGYRLIDTATIYGNEEAVGEGIKKSGVNRNEMFITSKVWVDDSGYEKAKKAFQTSLDKLQTDYLDLYLIHRPRGDVKGSWTAMEELYKEGKIKAIGISNFEDDQIKELMSYATIKPAVNQIETHAFYQQGEARKYLKDYGVQMEAWSPFAQGRNELFTNKTLAEIGSKYNKSNAQLSLRWHYQRGIVAIPRTSQKSHMTENLNIFDFELTDEEMNLIETLDLNTTQFPEWE